MRVVLCTKIDESLNKKLNELSRSLKIPKYELIEVALRRYVEVLERESKVHVDSVEKD